MASYISVNSGWLIIQWIISFINHKKKEWNGFYTPAMSWGKIGVVEEMGFIIKKNNGLKYRIKLYNIKHH